MSSVIGIDVGGTKIAGARYTVESWKMEKESQRKTETGAGFERVFEQLVTLIAELSAEDTIGAGIGVPGLIKQPEGLVYTLPNIEGAENFPLRERLSKRCSFPVVIENDSNCFTLGEASAGAGKGHSVVVGVTLGTGVGGGIVVNGKIFHGSNGYAGEVGHMLLMPGKPPYETNDHRGEVEQFLSGTAMGKRCGQAQTPKEYLEGTTCQSMHSDIVREVAWMCTNLTYILNPSVIVFGGSAGRSLKGHLPAIRKEFENWVLSKQMPLPTLAIATLPHAGTLGAAILAERNHS